MLFVLLKTPVRFDSDSTLPDPFDGLLIDHDGDLPMHACMGLPLLFGDKLLGVLTLDSLTPDVFANIPARNLEVLGSHRRFNHADGSYLLSTREPS